MKPHSNGTMSLKNDDSSGAPKSSSQANTTQKEQDSKKPKPKEDEAFSFHYYVFCLLLMLGFIVHSRRHIRYPNNYYVPIAAAHIVAYLVLRNRFSNEVFLSFLLFIAKTAIEMSPRGANHHNVMGFICLLLLPQQICRCWYGQVKSAGTEEALNVIRIVIVIMYFMAGFHKLNTDFFDSNVSCAYVMIRDYLAVVDIDVFEEEWPTWLTDLPHVLKVFELLPHAVIIVELLPPILLLFQSTQKWGVLGLLKLHGILVFVGFADFGSIAMSLLWLFVPPQTALDALPKYVYPTIAVVFVLFELCVRVVWFLEGSINEGPASVPFVREEAAMVFMAYAIVWVAVYQTDFQHGPQIRWPRSVFGSAAIIFFFWFAMNPYLGLRTAGTLSMFSNLRTEGETSNHLLLGSNPLKVFDYQEDLVEILDAYEPWSEAMTTGSIINRVSFEKELSDEKKEWLNADDWDESTYLTIKYKGKIYETDDVNIDPAFDVFRQKQPWYVRKWMLFRPVQSEGQQECAW